MKKRVLVTLAVAWTLCALARLSAAAAGTVTAGDMDGDGSVTVSDLRLLLKYVGGQDVILNAPGDVNGDGRPDMGDAARLLRYLVGWEAALYPEDNPSTEAEESSVLQLTINDTPVPVTREEMTELLGGGDVIVTFSDCGLAYK